MIHDYGKLLRRYIDAQKESLAILEILYQEYMKDQEKTGTATGVSLSSGQPKTTKKLFHVLFGGQQITEDEVRMTNVLDAIIEHEAPSKTFQKLLEKWNKKTVLQTGYGPVLNQQGYDAVPDAVKYKYQPNRVRTLDGEKLYVLKSWAMVRDKVTNTPGNFQMLLKTMAEYGYGLSPQPEIPPVLS